jgi:bifunctional non-homologous end joining protein LigD
MAGFIEPCLPSPAKAPPSGPDWLHEIKHDGFRLLACLLLHAS